jgi:NAD(P)H-hydrate repair Nnr-like enzyme with NAD(P)H-hydrate dehydratase domain
VAAWWACAVVRMASRAAYNEHGRSTGAVNIIDKLGSVMESLVPSPKL